MRTRIFLIGLLFAIATSFNLPADRFTRRVIEKTSIAARAWSNYCGYINAICNNQITVKISSNLSTAYVTEVKAGSTPLTFNVVSCTPGPPAAPTVFTVNINYLCNGVWKNYTGGAYTVVCP